MARQKTEEDWRTQPSRLRDNNNKDEDISRLQGKIKQTKLLKDKYPEY